MFTPYNPKILNLKQRQQIHEKGNKITEYINRSKAQTNKKKKQCRKEKITPAPDLTSTQQFCSHYLIIHSIQNEIIIIRLKHKQYKLYKQH